MLGERFSTRREGDSRRLSPRLAVILTLVALLLGTAAPASAYHRDRQAELQKQIANTQDKIADDRAAERDLLAKIAASDRRRADLERRIDAIQGELAAVQLKLRAIERRLKLATEELHYRAAELEGTVAALDYWRDALGDRIGWIYKGSPIGAADVYSKAQNVGEVAQIEEYASGIVESDEALVDKIEQVRVTVEDKRVTIEAKREQIKKDRAEVEAKARQILALRDEAVRARQSIQNEINYRSSLLRGVRDKKAAHERALRSMEAESNEIAEFLRGAQRGQGVIQGRGGWLKWPVSGRISSPYGWRTHPIYGNRSFHTGIDIAAPSGTTIKAARKGTVLAAEYNGAYGLMVLIDHGDSIATLYAHASKVYVRAGQKVDTLEKIAAVGSTGWSTGPHLHFEVRSNGQHTNPNAWL